MNERVKQFLENNEISYKLIEHKAVFTCDDVLDVEIPGQTLKNLFVRDKGSERFYLVVLPDHKRLDMKNLERLVGSKKLTFGKPPELMAKLGILPGSVSPLCLLNNPERDVKIFIDREGWEAPVVNIHPNENTASIVLDRENFHHLIEALGAEYEVYD